MAVRLLRFLFILLLLVILYGLMTTLKYHTQHISLGDAEKAKENDTKEVDFSRKSYQILQELLMHHQVKSEIQPIEMSISSVAEEVLWLNRATCEPQNNIAFLKIHKCASSTVQNILMRYGSKHELLFALPEKSHIFPLRKHFESSMIHTGAPFHTDKVNIFTMHAVWNQVEVSKVMFPEAVHITIVRDPMEAFLSLYDYFAFETFYKMPLHQFVAKNGIEMDRFMGCLSYNIMACDMGARPGDYINPKKIRLLTYQVDSDFDLVMVAERFEESLVLLAHLLCWPYEDLISLNVNSRFRKKDRLTPVVKDMLHDRLKPDYYIYNYFSEKFERLVQAFGAKRMTIEVDKLRETTERIIKDCQISKTIPLPNPDGKEIAGSSKVEVIRTNSTSPLCVGLVRPEQAFVGRIKINQEQLLKRKKSQIQG